MVAKLSQLAPGQRARIVSVGGAGPTRRRMLDLGLVAGTDIAAVRTAPLNDPVEYAVRGYHLAMRRRDAEAIAVELL
ncbi:ferrous iron transport protein A [bacterium]|nr:ferrous iron transport protein A [bacterium]